MIPSFQWKLRPGVICDAVDKISGPCPQEQSGFYRGIRYIHGGGINSVQLRDYIGRGSPHTSRRVQILFPRKKSCHRRRIFSATDSTVCPIHLHHTRISSGSFRRASGHRISGPFLLGYPVFSGNYKQPILCARIFARQRIFAENLERSLCGFVCHLPAYVDVYGLRIDGNSIYIFLYSLYLPRLRIK